MPLMSCCWRISVAEPLLSVCDVSVSVLPWWENLKVPKCFLPCVKAGSAGRACVRACVCVCVRMMYLLHYFEREFRLLCGYILGTAKLDIFHLARKVGFLTLRP